ncbi:MAG: PAS domain S-box protein, partial [Treponema sp.]|nr:PAS domain S-box protein [Treponema sp.]
MKGAVMDLNKQGQYFRLLLKNSPDNILFIDSHGYIDYCSDTFLKLSGLHELSRIQGMHFRDLYKLFEEEAFVRQAEQRFAGIIAAKSAVQSNVTINFPGTGEARMYTIQTTPMIDENGEFEGAQVHYLDVTDLLNAEIAARSRALLDGTPLACSLWDADGTLLDCNNQALKMFGLSNKQEYVDYLYDLSPEFQPDGSPSRKGMDERDQAALEAGFLQFEWMHQTLSGEPLPVETTLVRIPWMDSYVLATYSRDLREIKETRDELHHISSLVEATPNFELYTDGEGNIKYANPAVYEISGFSKEELLKGGLALFTDKTVLKDIREKYLPQIKEEHAHIA